MPALEFPAAPLSERYGAWANPVESFFDGSAYGNLLGLADSVLEPSR